MHSFLAEDSRFMRLIWKKQILFRYGKQQKETMDGRNPHTGSVPVILSAGLHSELILQ
jgi:hypothetical protein